MRWSSAALALALLTPAGASAGDFGLGVILGEPTGLSFKHWIGGRHAIDGAAAWSFTENASLQLHADYLVHGSKRLPGGSKGVRVPFYFGVGGRLKVAEDGRGRNADDALLGVRVPFGLTYLPSSGRFDVFLEIVPVLDLVPATEFDVNAAVGARFYF